MAPLLVVRYAWIASYIESPISVHDQGPNWFLLLPETLNRTRDAVPLIKEALVSTDRDCIRHREVALSDF